MTAEVLIWPSHMYTHIYTHTHVYTYICIHMYTHVYIHTHIYTHVHIHAHAHTHTYIHICIYMHQTNKTKERKVLRFPGCQGLGVCILQHYPPAATFPAGSLGNTGFI